MLRRFLNWVLGPPEKVVIEVNIHVPEISVQVNTPDDKGSVPGSVPELTPKRFTPDLTARATDEDVLQNFSDRLKGQTELPEVPFGTETDNKE